MSSGRYFLLISADRINATQRAQIHEAVKDRALQWWHQQADVWIVQTDDKTSVWRDRLRVFVTGVGGTLIVLRLPSEESDRAWATANMDGEWLRSIYAGGRRSRAITRE